MPFRHPEIRIHCQRVGLARERLSEIAETTASRIVERFQVDLRNTSVDVDVGGTTNSVVGHTVTIATRTGGGLSDENWFELLLAHELTHFVVREAWGLPPALFWEGLPVSLGDDYVRTRVLGRPYGQWCRALLELDRLLELTPLLRANVYYASRPDFRVDLEAGSFCGHLLRTRGAGRLGDFVRSVGRPPDDGGAWTITPALQRNLGGTLPELEEEWIAWLRATVTLEPSVLDRCASLNFSASLGSLHCDRCFSPVHDSRCTGCGRSDFVVELH